MKKNSGVKLTFYQSNIGMPFVSDGKRIAWFFCEANKEIKLGSSVIKKGEVIFQSFTIKKFEKERFSISKLNVIEGGFPLKYKKAGIKELERWRKNK